MQKQGQNIDNCSTEQKAILSALAAELFQKPLELPETVNWDDMFAESVNQTVFPLAFYAVRDHIPENIKNRWEPRFLQAIASNIRVTAAHSELHKILSEVAVPYVILKGCASSMFYPRPELRTMGDVDFLVDHPDLERCTSLLEKHGIRRIDDGTHDCHRTFSANRIEYELHWAITGIPAVGGEKIRAYFRDLITDAAFYQYADSGCRVPSDFHHGLILLLHTASHLTTTGIGLRHLCDWAVFVEKLPEETFQGGFEKCLKETGLWELAKILTMMSARYLGATPRQWAAGAEDALLDSLMDDIWRGGNFGEKDPQRKSYSVLMTDGDTHKIEDRGVLEALAIAIHRKAKLYHPRMAASGILLPCAWIAVCCRYSWRVLTKKRPWMKLGEDARTARQRKELFSRLKLFEE